MNLTDELKAISHDMQIQGKRVLLIPVYTIRNGALINNVTEWANRYPHTIVSTTKIQVQDVEITMTTHDRWIIDSWKFNTPESEVEQVTGKLNMKGYHVVQGRLLDSRKIVPLHSISQLFQLI